MVGTHNHFSYLHLDGPGRNVSVGGIYMVSAGHCDARTKATQTDCVVCDEQLVRIFGHFGQ